MRRIEETASQTADMVCGCRALSYYEKEDDLKCDDWIAPKLLPKILQFFVCLGLAKKALRKLLGSNGIYEWVIVRTKYIDSSLKTGIEEGVNQLLILGAGFDSRSIRFKDKLIDVKVFEVDAKTTQDMKIKQYKVRRIDIPNNIAFIPMNFEKESLIEKLKENKFDIDKKSFVILEGVTQYLNKESIQELFLTLQKILVKDSVLVFDYAHANVLQKQDDPDIKYLKKNLDKYGESWQFGFEEEEIESFLLKYGFKILDRKGPKELERTYFKSINNKVKEYHVNGTQSILKVIKIIE